MSRPEQIVDLLTRHGPMRLPEIACRMDLTSVYVNTYLDSLMKAGRIERTGRRRLYVYQIAQPKRRLSSVFDLGLPC